jgi:hypothetical protein
MIWGLLALGGITFWCATALFLLLVVWAVAKDHFGRGILVLLGYAALLSLFGDLWKHSIHPALFYVGIPAYFAAGIGWGIARWYLWLHHHADKYKEARRYFLVENKYPDATLDTPVPDELRDVFLNTRFGKQADFNAAANKGRIIGWMAMWPFSMLWTVLDEPWRRLYRALSAMFQRIADRVRKSTGIDMDLLPRREDRDTEQE